jgi:hypothetical protein
MKPRFMSISNINLALYFANVSGACRACGRTKTSILAAAPVLRLEVPAALVIQRGLFIVGFSNTQMTVMFCGDHEH